MTNYLQKNILIINKKILCYYNYIWKYIMFKYITNMFCNYYYRVLPCPWPIFTRIAISRPCCFVSESCVPCPMSGCPCFLDSYCNSILSFIEGAWVSKVYIVLTIACIQWQCQLNNMNLYSMLRHVRAFKLHSLISISFNYHMPENLAKLRCLLKKI